MKCLGRSENRSLSVLGTVARGGASARGDTALPTHAAAIELTNCRRFIGSDHNSVMVQKITLRSVAILAALVGVTLVMAPLHAAAKTFAWKATGKGGTVYLVGSVHLLSQDFYPLNPALDAAYKESAVLVEEVDLGEMSAPEQQFSLLSKGMLPSSQSLDTVLTPQTLALLNKK